MKQYLLGFLLLLTLTIGMAPNSAFANDIDTDGDGVPNDYDNCPDLPNGEQADVDNDNIGKRLKEKHDEKSALR